MDANIFSLGVKANKFIIFRYKIMLYLYS